LISDVLNLCRREVALPESNGRTSDQSPSVVAVESDQTTRHRDEEELAEQSSQDPEDGDTPGSPRHNCDRGRAGPEETRDIAIREIHDVRAVSRT
jgi:hypothetical protein